MTQPAMTASTQEERDPNEGRNLCAPIIIADYRGLPPDLHKHVDAVADYIGDTDGKNVYSGPEDALMDDGTIDGTEAVIGLNGLIAALRAQPPQPTGDVGELSAGDRTYLQLVRERPIVEGGNPELTIQELLSIIDRLDSRLVETEAKRVSDGERVQQAEQSLRVAREAAEEACAIAEEFSGVIHSLESSGVELTPKQDNTWGIATMRLNRVRAALSTEARGK